MPVSDEGWGLLTRFKVPGAGDVALYEPRHASPLGLLERLWKRNDLGEDEAADLAVEAQHETRLRRR